MKGSVISEHFVCPFANTAHTFDCSNTIVCNKNLKKSKYLITIVSFTVAILQGYITTKPCNSISLNQPLWWLYSLQISWRTPVVWPPWTPSGRVDDQSLLLHPPWSRWCRQWRQMTSFTNAVLKTSHWCWSCWL